MDFKSRRKTIEISFNVQDGYPKVLKEEDAYQHIGVPTGFKVKQTPVKNIEKIEEGVEKIDRSLLSPWQKMP